MAGAIGRRMEHRQSQTWEDHLSNDDNKVVRLPRQPRPAAPATLLRHQLQSILTDLVERKIVPRLVSAHAGAAGDPSPLAPVVAPIPPIEVGEDVVAFCQALLQGPEGEADAIVAGLRGQGVSPQTISLSLLSVAARHLGDLWSSDRISFADVTHATFILQRIFRDLAAALPAEPVDAGRSALLVATPGEQHSFGLSMLATFFRNAGWEVQSPVVRSAVDLQRRVASGVDLLGISLGAEIHLQRLARCIALARRGRGDRRLVIMVGGPIFIAHPELAARVGADATAPDAATALAQARLLLDGRAAGAHIAADHRTGEQEG